MWQECHRTQEVNSDESTGRPNWTGSLETLLGALSWMPCCCGQEFWWYQFIYLYTVVWANDQWHAQLYPSNNNSCVVNSWFYGFYATRAVFMATCIGGENLKQKVWELCQFIYANHFQLNLVFAGSCSCDVFCTLHSLLSRVCNGFYKPVVILHLLNTARNVFGSTGTFGPFFPTSVEIWATFYSPCNTMSKYSGARRNSKWPVLKPA